MKSSTTKVKAILGKLLAAALYIALWQLCYFLVNKELLIAAPAHVAGRLIMLVQTPEFWLSAGASILRIMSGFLLAMALGGALALLCSFARPANTLFGPLITIIRATPVASFIILALVWIKAGGVPVFISFLMVLPIVWGNLTQGFKSADTQLLEMARSYKFTRKKLIRHIYVPTLLPYFTAAWTTGLGLAWKAGISAEVIGVTPLSIGRELREAKLYLETADLFAWTLVVILLSVLLERLLKHAILAFAGRFNKGVG